MKGFWVVLVVATYQPPKNGDLGLCMADCHGSARATGTYLLPCWECK